MIAISSGQTGTLYLRTLVSRHERRFEIGPALRTTADKVHEFKIHRIQIASPGFIEFVGSLNPLKTMADFITNWRIENTKRMELVLAHQRALVEQATAVIKAAPSPEFADRLLRAGLDEPKAKLKQISREIRIDQVSAHSLKIGDGKPRQ